MTRRLIVRADSGPDIGLGHVMRCLALAEEAQDRGVDVLMVLGGVAGVAAARRRGFAVIPTRRGAFRLDVVQPGDVLVIDGYHFPPALYDRARDRGPLVVAVDDRPGASPSADVIVAPDVMAPEGREGSGAVVLEGTKHALVRREFYSRRRLREALPRGGPLLITLGGADPHRLTATLAVAAVNAAGGWAGVEVLVGPAAAVSGTFDRRVTVVSDPVDVGAVFDRAGAVVSAAGSSAWELLAMGQVCALLATVWDQEPVVDAVRSARAALTHGGGLAAAPEFIAQVLPRLRDRSERRALSERALDLIDGRGAHRVVDTILAL